MDYGLLQRTTKKSKSKAKNNDNHNWTIPYTYYKIWKTKAIYFFNSHFQLFLNIHGQSEVFFYKLKVNSCNSLFFQLQYNNAAYIIGRTCLLPEKGFSA